MSTKTDNGRAEILGPVVTNDASRLVAIDEPYSVEFTIEGVCPILFHAWSNEAVAAKASARKNSTQKKTDDVESYVYRNDENEICIPGVYMHRAIQLAAKFRQDPRSPRKSAFDLYCAAAVPMTEFASLGSTSWDYLDRRRVTVQRAGITRERPAFLAGWRATFEFMVTLPEYVAPMDLLDVITLAGRCIGVADFRPTYGRFSVVSFEVLSS